uniref:Phosphodiesterase n=1 Tax=Tetraselmis sp. GSL018 TaxID=582737 RepID=A0A061QRP8_9CHLO|mmetsp:Transcript_5633/g.13671  ORF Transcript_5633/g.13671 Transcript_5633/m.13671 type:complete len:460 (+) Transcript_5633:100-1479(+)
MRWVCFGGSEQVRSPIIVSSSYDSKSNTVETSSKLVNSFSVGLPSYRSDFVPARRDNLHVTPEPTDLFRLQYSLPVNCRLAASINKFDALQLYKATTHPLAATAVAAFRNVGLQLKLDLTKFQNFSLAVEATMKPNSYHNSLHVVDVLHLMYLQTISRGPIEAMCCDPIVKLAVILSALVHDLAHPGYNNAFLIATNHDIVKQYGKVAPAESMHLAEFKRLISEPNNNFVEELSQSDRERLFHYVEQTVLATDMSKHMDYIREPVPLDPEQRLLFTLAFAMKVSDMSHNLRSFPVHNKFVDMLKEEFYQQGDRERQLELQITLGMDRDEAYADIGEFQVRFLSAFISPLLERWYSHSGQSPLVKEMQRCLLENISMWSMLSIREGLSEREDDCAELSTSQRVARKLMRRPTQAFANGYGMHTQRHDISRAIDVFKRSYASHSLRKSIDRSRLTVPHGAV